MLRSLHSNDQRKRMAMMGPSFTKKRCLFIFPVPTGVQALTGSLAHWPSHPHLRGKTCQTHPPVEIQRTTQHSSRGRTLEPTMTVKSFRQHENSFLTLRETSLLTILCQHRPHQQNTQHTTQGLRAPNLLPLPPTELQGFYPSKSNN